jgi:hypothetical protein
MLLSQTVEDHQKNRKEEKGFPGSDTIKLEMII